MSELVSSPGEPESTESDGPGSVRARLFGPLEIRLDGRELPVQPPQERALLALLLTTPNRVVAVSEIVAGLWGERAPRGATRTVQSYVSRLRRALGERATELVVTRAPGYIAAVAPQQVDTVRFAELTDGARRALTADRPARAAELARQALELGRGEVLAEFDAPFAVRERTRLGELRLLTLETRIDADLALGGGPELVGELEELVATHPLRERLWEQLIVALYRAGRQADALTAYRRIRSTLVEELGIEPGHGLRDLERRVLAQDPTLLGPASGAPLPPALSTANRLCGRDEELAWLTNGYRLSRSGRVICRLVDGPAGIGKTRLVAELTAAAHHEGTIVYYARGGDVAALTQPPGGRPSIIVADDLHLAAPEQVTHVLRLVSAAAGPLLVVLVAQRAQLPADTAAALARIRADELVLGELSATAVADLIREYLGDDRDTAHATAALAHVGGAPGRVHRAVRKWAQRHQERQVTDAARRVPIARDQLSADQDQLLDRVLSLQRFRQSDTRGDDNEPGVAVCPYKGLSAFETDDAEFFFGRERLVAHLVTRLVGTRLLAIVGNSGIGKTSTVRAGLMPALSAGTLPGSAAWTITMNTPAQGLPQIDPDAEHHHLVVVDQFEEVFTTLGGAARGAYLDQLIALVRPGTNTTALITLRADYYPHCATRDDLAALLADNTVLVAPMSVDELRAAIEGPAGRAGLTLDEGLTDTLVGDVVDQAGALPLLSTALLSLWEHRDGNRLTLRGYLSTGGVRQAINELAESAYTRLDATQRTIARRLLLRLADSGEGGEYIRRRAPLHEIAPDENARRVIDALSSRRLITVTEDAVEIAHEAVLREWPRLRGWLDDDEVGRRLRSHMTIAAYEWSARGRDPAELYRGPRLTAALEWMDQNPDDVTAAEREYLEAGREAAEIETLRKRRSIRRLQAFAGALAIVLVVALAAGGVAVLQGQRADREAVAAEARALRARAATDTRWDRALLYAAQAEHLEPTSDSRATLLSTLQRSPQAIGVLRADARIQRLAVSADGSRLAGGANTGQVMVWETTSHHRVATVKAIPDPLWAPSVDLTDDGRLLVAVGYSTENPGLTGDTTFISVTDLNARPAVPRQLPLEHVVGAAFLPHNTLVIRQQDGRLREVDSVAGAPVPGPIFKTPILRGECSLPYLNISANRRFVATGCGGSPEQPAGVWDVRTGQTIWPGPSDGALLSDNLTTVLSVNSLGTMLIRGRSDGRVDAIDLTTHHVRTSVDAHIVGVGSVTWSADGKAFVSTAERTSMIWDPTTIHPVLTLHGHTSGVRDATFAPDGRTLYTGGFDDTVFIWDVDGHRRVAQPVGHTTGYKANYQEHAFDDAGTLVATALANGTIDVTDLTPLDGPGNYVIAGPEAENIVDIDMDRAGAALAYEQYDDTHGLVGRVLEIRKHQLRPFSLQVDSPLPGRATGAGIGISGDGRWLTTVDFEGRTRQWDAITGAPRSGVAYQAEQGAGGPVLSQDGHLVALTSPTDVQLVNLASQPPRLVATVPALIDIAAPAFSADGRLLAVGTGLGDVVIVDTTSAAVLHRWPGTDGPALNAVRFGPDSHYLLSGEVNGKATVWNISTAPNGAAIIDFGSAGGNTISGAFRGTSAILTIDSAGSVLLWDIDATSLAARACAIVGRNLTQEEWRAVLPDRPYEQTCPGNV